MKEKVCSVGARKESVPAHSKIYDLVWKLVFRELSQEEMIQLAYEIVLCSMMDPCCRDKAKKALKEVIR